VLSLCWQAALGVPADEPPADEPAADEPAAPLPPAPPVPEEAEQAEAQLVCAQLASVCWSDWQVDEALLAQPSMQARSEQEQPWIQEYSSEQSDSTALSCALQLLCSHCVQACPELLELPPVEHPAPVLLLLLLLPHANVSNVTPAASAAIIKVFILSVSLRSQKRLPPLAGAANRSFGVRQAFAPSPPDHKEFGQPRPPPARRPGAAAANLIDLFIEARSARSRGPAEARGWRRGARRCAAGGRG
jgi:hypothetical protein